MKKIFLASLVLIVFGCSKNESNNSNNSIPEYSNPTSTTVVELSNLSSANFEILNEQKTLDFGSATSVETIKSIKIKNNSASSKALDLQISGEGYSIKINRCPNSLSSGESCDITLSFISRGLYNGEKTGELLITDSPDDLGLSLTALIENKPDPNGGPSELEIYINNPFYNENQTPGQLITRDIIVKNSGNANISSVDIELKGNDYVTRIDQCGSLRVNQTCRVQVAYRDYRNSVPTESSMGSITASASNVSAPASLSLASGTSINNNNSILINWNFTRPEMSTAANGGIINASSDSNWNHIATLNQSLTGDFKITYKFKVNNATSGGAWLGFVQGTQFLGSTLEDLRASFYSTIIVFDGIGIHTQSSLYHPDTSAYDVYDWSPNINFFSGYPYSNLVIGEEYTLIYERSGSTTTYNFSGSNINAQGTVLPANYLGPVIPAVSLYSGQNVQVISTEIID